MRPLGKILPLRSEQLNRLHRYLYLLGLMTIACGLGWSNALMSIGQFILLGNWILEGDFIAKWQKIRRDRLLQFLLSLFALVLIGFLWTEDFDYAIKDARIKIPLLLLPLIVASSERLKQKEFQLIIGVYISTLLLLYLASLGKLYGLIGDREIQDKRELSIFISHIRYGLNLLMGAVIAFYFAPTFQKNLQKIVIIIGAVLLSSLLILQLYTALVIAAILLLAVLIRLIIFKKISLYIRILAVGFGIIAIAFSIHMLNNVYRDFHTLPELTYDQNDLKKYTLNNREYLHFPDDKLKENGVYLWRFVQLEELEQEWDKRSEFNFYGNDKRGNTLKNTLIRFLASKGVTKDSAGMAQLSDEEIRGVENGIPNHYYLNHYPIQNRIYTTLYEIENYRKFGYAEGFSMGMRLEFWKTAWRIIEKQPLMGVGTGDVQNAFEVQYHLDNSSLSEKNRRRAHNQFLTIWLTFGFVGLIWFLSYLFYPLYLARYSFYPIFLLIATISFLTEDTLETQAGVTFFAFFNAVLLLGYTQARTSK